MSAIPPDPMVPATAADPLSEVAARGEFDDSLLDDEAALAAADPVLRHLAEAGARVRREVLAAKEILAGLEPRGG